MDSVNLIDTLLLYCLSPSPVTKYIQIKEKSASAKSTIYIKQGNQTDEEPRNKIDDPNVTAILMDPVL